MLSTGIYPYPHYHFSLGDSTTTISEVVSQHPVYHRRHSKNRLAECCSYCTRPSHIWQEQPLVIFPFWQPVLEIWSKCMTMCFCSSYCLWNRCSCSVESDTGWNKNLRQWTRLTQRREENPLWSHGTEVWNVKIATECPGMHWCFWAQWTSMVRWDQTRMQFMSASFHLIAQSSLSLSSRVLLCLPKLSLWCRSCCPSSMDFHQHWNILASQTLS